MLDRLVEQKIAEAIARGDFDDLPGAGHALDLDDDPLVPEDLRLAYRILKNAGFLPPEVEALNPMAQLERLVTAGHPVAGVRAAKKLALLKARLSR
jgi:hypothetical protein